VGEQVVSDRFDFITILFGELGSRRAIRRGWLGVAAGVIGFASAIPHGDLTSEAKPKRKRKKRRMTRQCSGADDCPAPDNPCETAICRRRRCRVRNKLVGTPCGEDRECRDGVCEIPCDGLCTGGRICRNDACVCPESGVCEISPTALDGWSIPDDERVSFVDGPGEPPLGSGSVRLSTIEDLGSAIGNILFDGVSLATISALGFATYVEDGAGAQDGVPSLEFHILLGGDTDEATLEFEPENTVNASVQPKVWQAWDALSADARWTVDGGPDCEDGCVLMSWDEVLAALPGANIVGPIVIKSGHGASDATGYVDAVRINDLTYDFEPDAS
jgi:hypothetical protein